MLRRAAEPVSNIWGTWLLDGASSHPNEPEEEGKWDLSQGLKGRKGLYYSTKPQ